MERNFNLYTGNSLPKLIDILSKITKKPLRSFFEKEIVIVQSPGMKRWITLELSKKNEILANTDFLFPNVILNRIFDLLNEKEKIKVPDRDEISWKIFSLLPELIEDESATNLKKYVNNEPNTIKGYQLSAQISNVFDQYMLMRTEMLNKWNDEGVGGWQGVLWRKINFDGGITRLNQITAFKDALNSLDLNKIKSLPERINIFGVSTLPEHHMEIFYEISKYIEVNFFIFNPCREYWGDLLSDGQIVRWLNRNKKHTEEELHLMSGNSLLASMGSLGADFMNLLTDLSDNREEFFYEIDDSSILKTIQKDILELNNRGVEGNSFAPQKNIMIEEVQNDNSLRVHSCHSEMREVEVLYDFLLKELSENETSPSDVLVMTTDIEKYAPLVDAVFGGSSDEESGIAYSIADRSVRGESPLVEKFLGILDLSNSRFTASEIFWVLDNEDILEKFNLNSSDVEVVKRWVGELNINWGLNAEFKEAKGLPGFDENSWKVGFDSMFYGFAMDSSDENLYDKVLPYENIEGAEFSGILGKFSNFFNSLKESICLLDGKFTLYKWAEKLILILEDMFELNENNNMYYETLLKTIFKLKDIEKESFFKGEVDIYVIKTWLSSAIDAEEVVATKFLTGDVTVCATLPMRTIPFKIICFLGMNDSVFPRSSKTLGFDEIAKSPKPGDRSQRNDDRYLFLESLVSAEEKLHISYIGQSIKDNSSIPPSVLISELLEYISQGFVLKEDEETNISDLIHIKHRLQPFNLDYFKGDPELYSFSKINFKAAKLLQNEKEQRLPFLKDKIIIEENKKDEVQSVEIDDFIKFFNDPVKYFVNSTLGIYFEDSNEELEDSEPFSIDGLDNFKIKEDLVSKLFEDEEFDIENFVNLRKAKGELPHGKVADISVQEVKNEAESFLKKIEKYDSPICDSVNIDFSLNDIRLIGKIRNIRKDYRLAFRSSKVKSKDRIKDWIYHLILTVSENRMKTIYVGKDLVLETDKVANATENLKKLIEVYIKGKSEVIPFFPELSLEYVSEFMNSGDNEKGLIQAKSKWEPGFTFDSDVKSEVYNKFCFRYDDLFLGENEKNFIKYSELILADMVKTQKVGK